MDNNSGGQIFLGVVSSFDAGSYIVTVDPIGDNKHFPQIQGIPLASVFSTAIGFKECAPPAIGVKVVCLYAGPLQCYILGQIPDGDVGDVQWASRAALKAAGDGVFDGQNNQGYAEKGTKIHTINNNRPTDIIEGEVVWANEFGVLFGALQQLALLKGSELSQVQAFLLDDLVRIISHNFEHFTALGEYRIYHDGKAIMAEFGATHLSRESLGIPQTQDKADKVFEKEGPTTKKDDEDFYGVKEDERIQAIERFKILVGRLSDFFHLFLVRPDDDTVKDLSGTKPSTPDRGLFDFHIGTDGGFHFRTLKGGSIEKTNWIRVPQRIRTPEDPEGDDAKNIEYEDKDPFEFKDDFTYKDNPFLYFLQIRNASMYLQNKYAYQNLDKHEKDFYVEKDPEKEKDLSGIDEIDPNTKTNFSNWTLRTSGVYLMDNGGIMLKDAWGSALVLEGGNIYIQPAKDEIHQPLRNYIVKAGQFVNIAAKKDIDFSSTEEGIRIKAEKCAYLFSNTQGVIIDSNAEEDTAPEPKDEAVERVGGIVFRSKKGIYNLCESHVILPTKQALCKSPMIHYEGTDQLLLTTKGNFTFAVPGNINFFAAGDIRAVASKSAFFGGLGGTIFGHQDDDLGVKYDTDNPFVDPIKGALPDSVFDSIQSTIDAYKDNDPQKKSPIFREESDVEEFKFRWLASNKYDLNDNEDIIPQTIGQQESELSGSGLSAWAEIEVNETKPFPGKDKWDNSYVTSTLINLQTKDGDLISKSVDTLEGKQPELERKSLDEYKTIS